MSDKETRTEINQLGEFALIDRLTDPFSTLNESTFKSIGDDAAVIRNGNKLTVVSTDLMVEGVHFDLVYVPLKHLGYKSVVVNLSDIYAMNAIPKQITFSLAVSNRFSVEALEEIYEGILAACKKYGVDLIGGDTTSSVEGLLISVTAIGEAEESSLVYRNGAKEGDLICVSGDLGASYLGLQLLEREKQVYLENPEIKPDLEEQDILVGKQLKPEARQDIIKQLEENKLLPTSMIDISDGLSSELMHICAQSDVGCEILEAKIPMAEESRNMAFKFQLDPTTCALSGGEDYELLFTVNPDDKLKVANLPDVSIIGKVKKASHGIKLLSKGGNIHDITSLGWDSFNNEQ
ncbi:MAG: thiamine-phosphate kinase [Bacteroidetes bacterium]|nr:thiamine-phosphate kinase [Bacteroidota bacterium]